MKQYWITIYLFMLLKLHLFKEQDEKMRVKLEYDLEKVTEELKIVQNRECLIAGEIVEKKQAIYQINLEKVYF